MTLGGEGELGALYLQVRQPKFCVTINALRFDYHELTKENSEYISLAWVMSFDENDSSWTGH